jgi:Cellulase (glycosyl hydrolase family 5)
MARSTRTPPDTRPRTPATGRPARWGTRVLAGALVLPVVVGLTWFPVQRDDGGDAPPPVAESPYEPLTTQELASAEDALHRRTLAELAVFTDWLERNGADGYIGEVGIPGGVDGDRWVALGQRWFTAAADAGLWVDVWSVGEWWRQDYTYSPYVSEADGGPLSITREQGALLMWAAENTELPRGVNLSGGEFGAPGGSDEASELSNADPGRYDEDYHYDGRESLDYLASRGIDTVRLPFRWERVQPEPGGPLDAEEVDRLLTVVQAADAAGLQVVLDVHNFGAYHVDAGDGGVRRAIGSDELPISAFADLWQRLSLVFDGVPGVLAYDLMNEPVYLPSLEADDRTGAQLWEQASQAAVDAVRGRGDDTLIMVPGYGYSHAGEWAQMHPDAWITDPEDNVRYTAHHYWSPERGVSYDDDLAEAVDDGY